MTDLAAIAAEHGLVRVGTRPPLRTYLRQVWARRDFAVALATSKAYARHQGGYLGQLWAVLTPLLWAAVYLVVFGAVLATDRGVANFAGFLVTGVFLFHFTAAAIQNGATAITGHQSLITSLQFPRAVLPVATVLAELLTLLPALAVLVVLLPVTGEPVQASWLLLPVAVGLQWAFGTGCAFLLARLVAHVRDAVRLVPFLLRVLMYGSGVFFSVEHYVGDPIAAAALQHQPVAVYLELARGVLLQDASAPGAAWAWGVAWAAVTLVVGFCAFWRAEEVYSRG